MGIFDVLGSVLSNSSKKREDGRANAIPYGGQTTSGDHDHRTNKGGDRTPAQKRGDQSRRK